MQETSERRKGNVMLESLPWEKANPRRVDNGNDKKVVKNAENIVGRKSYLNSNRG
jgi:hypothetical protein